MTSKQDNKGNSGDNNQAKNDSFFGIKSYNQEQDLANNSSSGLTWSVGNDPQNSSNLAWSFGNNTQNTNITDNSSPAFKDLLNKLEGAVRANKFDRDTLDLFRQISQLSNIDSILKGSAVINMATLSILRDKEREFVQEQSQNNVVNNNNDAINNQKIIDDNELKKMQAEFLEVRNSYQKSLEEKARDLPLNNQLTNNQRE